MSRYASLMDLAAKIDWEGGIDAALEYGIKAEHIPDHLAEMKELWAELEKRWWDYVEIREKVEDLLPDPYTDEE